MMMMMMMMKLPILPCAEKLELVLSTAPKTSDNTDKDSNVVNAFAGNLELSICFTCLNYYILSLCIFSFFAPLFPFDLNPLCTERIYTVTRLITVLQDWEDHGKIVPEITYNAPQH